MKAIYQLNKYNKAWLNTNLAKTPTLFTVEFQELLEIFWETYRFNSREFFTFISIHTLRWQKLAFYTKQDFSRALSFPHHTLCSEPEHSFVNSFWIDWLRTRRTSISRAVLEIEANAVIYIHIIHAYNVFRRALNSFNWRALTINNHRSSAGFRSNHRSFIAFCFVWSEIVGPHSSGNCNDWSLKLKASSKIWVVVIGMR